MKRILPLLVVAGLAVVIAVAAVVAVVVRKAGPQTGTTAVASSAETSTLVASAETPSTAAAARPAESSARRTSPRRRESVAPQIETAPPEPIAETAEEAPASDAADTSAAAAETPEQEAARRKREHNLETFARVLRLTPEQMQQAEPVIDKIIESTARLEDFERQFREVRNQANLPPDDREAVRELGQQFFLDHQSDIITAVRDVDVNLEQLRPYLTPDQTQRFEEFSKKIRAARDMVESGKITNF